MTKQDWAVVEGRVCTQLASTTPGPVLSLPVPGGLSVYMRRQVECKPRRGICYPGAEEGLCKASHSVGGLRRGWVAIKRVVEEGVPYGRGRGREHPEILCNLKADESYTIIFPRKIQVYFIEMSENWAEG